MVSISDYKKFRDNDVWIYEKNKRLYIDLISSDLNDAFRNLSNKRYKAFSVEMESATINAFKNADNMDKIIFLGGLLEFGDNIVI